MKKKSLALLLSLSMALGLLAGCGGSTETGVSAAASSTPSEAPEATAAAPAQEGAASEAAASAEEPVISESSIAYPVGNSDSFSIAIVMDTNYLDVLPEGDPANADGMKIMSEKTGVNLDYTVFPMMSDNMSLMIASGDWTDILLKLNENYSTGIVGALGDDVIMDLAPYVEEYAPDYYSYIQSSDFNRKGAYTDDGKMGAFANFGARGIEGYGIRKDWLDEAGIDAVPETYDELENAFLAIKDNHPELTRCMPMAASFIQQGYESLLSLGYGIDTINQPFFRNEDGKIAYAWTQDGAREYLTMIARWVDEGILNKDEMLTGDIADTMNDIYLGKSAVIHSDAGMWGDSYMNMVEDPNFEMVPMNEIVKNKGDAIRFLPTEQKVDPYWSISTTCENPELLMQAINWIYTKEGTEVMNFGVLDKTYTIDDEGNYHFTDLVLNNPDGVPVFMATSLYTGFETPKIAMDQLTTAKLTKQVQLDAVAFWQTQERTADGHRRGTLTEEEQQAVSKYADIQTYVSEKAMAFATGETEITDESWNDFVQNIENSGIDEIIAAYQAAQDRYDAK